MSTFYFDKRDYRHDMRDPYSAARAHAMVRKVCAVRDQQSAIYGALYWNACKMQHDAHFGEAAIWDVYQGFISECNSWHPQMSLTQIEKLWKWAEKKIRAIFQDGINLDTSVRW